MIKPEGVKLLIIPEQVEEKTKGGIYLPDTARDMQQVAATRGTVVAIGPDVVSHFEDGPIDVGDFIIYAKYGGAVIEDEGTEYRVINDDDVLARVVKQE